LIGLPVTIDMRGQHRAATKLVDIITRNGSIMKNSHAQAINAGVTDDDRGPVCVRHDRVSVVVSPCIDTLRLFKLSPLLDGSRQPYPYTTALSSASNQQT
jgi:hypothetical protein